MLVEEPPAAAELHLAGRRAVLEIADHRGHHFVVGRVEIVEDRLGQPAVAVQAVEEPGHRPGDLEIADRIETGVRAERLEHPRVVVPQGAEVELLHPAFLVVHHGQLVKHGRLELRRSGRVRSGLPPRTRRNAAEMSLGM